MIKVIRFTVLMLLAVTCVKANADEEVIRKALNLAMPASKVDSVKPSVIKGLYEAAVGANIYYVSEDGKYLIQGRLVDIAARKDLTEEKLNGTRKLAIENMGKENMIIFAAKIPKYTVTIFTDIDCGYCRKLHSELDQYSAQGITIQY